jgi:hypothetical protein
MLHDNAMFVGCNPLEVNLPALIIDFTIVSETNEQDNWDDIG